LPDEFVHPHSRCRIGDAVSEFRFVHDDEPPWLGVVGRGRQTCGFDALHQFLLLDGLSRIASYTLAYSGQFCEFHHSVVKFSFLPGGRRGGPVAGAPSSAVQVKVGTIF